MASKTVDLRLVGIALLPALGVSIAIVLIGRVLDLPDSTVNRISALVFFALFFGGYHYARRRRAAAGSYALKHQ